MASDDAKSDREPRIDDAPDSSETTQERSNPETRSDGATGDSTDVRSESRMLARTWQIAYGFREPTDYGIPELPAWRVRRDDDGALAFAGVDSETAFIVAENPVRVRR